MRRAQPWQQVEEPMLPVARFSGRLSGHADN